MHLQENPIARLSPQRKIKLQSSILVTWYSLRCDKLCDIIQPYIIYVHVLIFMHTSIYLCYLIHLSKLYQLQPNLPIYWLLISYMCTGSEWYSGHSYWPNKIWRLAVQLILVLPVKGGIKQLCSILASHSILNGTVRKEKKWCSLLISHKKNREQGWLSKSTSTIWSGRLESSKSQNTGLLLPLLQNMGYPVCTI